MRPTKLFLFDLDGTLVSTGGAGLKALGRTFEQLYNLRDAHTLISPHGKTDPAIFRELMKTHLQREISQDDHTLIINTYLKYLSIEIRYSRTYTVLPGVHSFLGHLMTRGDILLGLGTGNLEKAARIKLMKSGLNPYLPFGGFGSDAEQRHELLTMGHQRAEKRCRAKIQAENVYVIGDTPLDVAAARAAGFQAVAVAQGANSVEELSKTNPDFLLESLKEGFDFLRNIDRGRAKVSA